MLTHWPISVQKALLGAFAQPKQRNRDWWFEAPLEQARTEDDKAKALPDSTRGET